MKMSKVLVLNEQPLCDFISPLWNLSLICLSHTVHAEDTNLISRQQPSDLFTYMDEC